MENLTPRVQITILARDHAHTLPLFFECVENIDYDPKYLSIYIHTNDNNDNTSVLLKEWSDEQKRQGKYANVYFLEESYPALKNNPGKSSLG